MRLKNLTLLALLSVLAAGCSSSDDGLDNLPTQQEESQLAKADDSPFMKAFVDGYWNVVEYGLLMDDGTKEVVVDEEGHVKSEWLPLGGTLFPGINVLNDSIMREFFVVFTGSDELDGKWYQDVPFTFDSKSSTLTHESLGLLLSDRLTLDSLGEDCMRFTGEWLFATQHPEVRRPYYVLRKLSDVEGASLYREYKQKK